MIVKMVKVQITRYNTPSNRALDRHIKRIERVNLGEIETDILPGLNDIIKFMDHNYKVIKVIRHFDTFLSEDFYLDVIPYDTHRYHEYGSDTWTEEIPLVLDIPEEGIDISEDFYK
jgi:hypothetical protein